MLEAKNSGSAQINPNYQTLLAFRPRQVLLAERTTKSTTMKQRSSKILTLNPDQKALLLQSVLGYLDRNGFSKALKRLLSEAQIENDNWKACSLTLEDLYGNYLETCTHAGTNLDTHKDQELLTDETKKKSGASHSSASEQTVGNKKKKNSNKGDNNAVENRSENGIAESCKNSIDIPVEDSIADSTVELKEKKKSKKVSVSLQQTKQVSIQALKESTADTVSELQIDESLKKQMDKKKKKSKSISESHDSSVERVPVDSLQAANEEKFDNSKPSLGEVKIDSEPVKYEVKKKKHKPSNNLLGDDVEHFGLVDKKGSSKDKIGGNVEQEQSVSLLVAMEYKSNKDNKFDSEAEGKPKDKKKKKELSADSLIENVEQYNSALEDSQDAPLEEKKVESRKQKGKKGGSVSNTLFGDVPKKEDPITRELKNEASQTLGDAIDKEKKSSKKRKRLASEETEAHPVEKLKSEESKRRKTETLEETKICEQITEVNANARDYKHVGIENKRENGNNEKDGVTSAAQKTRRKQHEGSAEPKTVNAFQRVKIDEVKFADERLQDNSYWAKDGADVGYGAKAQEILGQVKGRDFRHEKTKKKRGSYRGGLIDLQAHSVKFNYSDED